MSASFLAAVLEIPRDKDPDWEAARTHIGHLTEEETIGVVCEANQTDNIEEAGIEDARAELIRAVKYLEDNWDEHLVYLSSTKICVFAGDSWGDPIEGITEADLLAISGAAKKAGFI